MLQSLCPCKHSRSWPRRRAATWALAVAYLLAPAWTKEVQAQTQAATSYAWLDADGALHTEQDLRAVPEPYGSAYRVRRDALAAARQAASRADGQVSRSSPSGATPAPVYLPSYGAALQQADARMAWRTRMVQGREAALVAVLRLQEGELALAAEGSNPVLRLLPPVQARLALGAQRLQTLRQAALSARRYVTDELPQQARQAQVPPQWLLP